MHRTKMLVAGTMLSGLVLAPLTSAGQEVDYQPITIGAEAGTLGLGVSANWRFFDYLGIRSGINYFNFEDDSREIEGITYDSELRLQSFPLALDIYLWKDRSFRITVGVLFNQNEVTGKQEPNPGDPPITIGNNFYSPTEYASLDLKVEQQFISPFISIGGSFYLDRAKHWSISGELGVAYTGSPDASLSMQGGNAAASLAFETDGPIEEAEIEDKMEDYKFYPIVKIGVNFSF